MKRYIIDFLKRGSLAAVGGPIVMAIVYLILDANNVVETISVSKISTEILTVTLMAFIAAGITIVYQIERLPLFSAALIHGAALYIDYIIFYLLNGWLKAQKTPILIFSVVFIVGYTIIWLIINIVTKKNVEKLNQRVQEK